MKTLPLLLSFSFTFIFIFPTNSNAEDVKNNGVSDARTPNESFRPQHEVRYYGEKMIQAVKDENYDDLLKFFLEMAHDYKMDPKEDFSTLLFLCSIYFLRAEPENVMELLERFNDEKKSHPIFLYISGNCNAIAGNYEKSICHFTELIDEIEKNKLEYQQEYKSGYLKKIPMDFFSSNTFEEFLGAIYSYRACLYVMVGNTYLAREDWKKSCILSNRPELISSFFANLETMEQSSNVLKCVFVKKLPDDYVRIEEESIFFRLNIRFDWEEWQEFSTLSAEREFWDEWQEKNHSAYNLDTFFLRYAPKQIDTTLAAIMQPATSIVLIIETATNSSILRIILLTKANDRWKLTEWELVTKDGIDTMEKSMVDSPQIDEDCVKTLSECPVTFIPREGIVDAGSVIMFVKHSGKSNRLAIHFPEQLYEKERSQMPIASAIKSLLQSAGVLSFEGDEENCTVNYTTNR